VNVAVFSAHATAIEFCLFEDGREVRRVKLRGRTGDVFHDLVPDVLPGARYGLRTYGPFQPREGHRFNPAKLLVDPYARALDAPLAISPTMFAYRPDAPDKDLSFDDTDSAPFVAKAIVSAPEAGCPATGPLTPWSDTVLYELHVRGFTMRHPLVPPELRGRFAGLAHPAAIEHLVRLGVTSVEIMPSAAWIEERHLAALGLRNYWGYNPVALMAPDPRLAPGGWAEVRQAVAALAAAGIETILDVVLNHTGEGDALGPTLSLRGLDNATYFHLPPDAPWRYMDDSGTGNTLALDRPAPLRLAMDALRTWANQTGLHGFRFDLASVMGRRADGFDPAAPLLSAIAQDPVLRGLKLIAEPWDVGWGGYQAGHFPAPWGEWNDRFRDGVRRFWRGDAGMAGELATRLAGSSDLFAGRNVASRSVNFVVAHDGFTLADLVSYERKSNGANGEDNRDGTDDNHSWNSGAEGPTDDPATLAARRGDQRALLATLLLARGTPMLAMGSEIGQSQGGNNNAYAQDNATAWLDWDRADSGLAEWVARLLRIRREHAVLHADAFLTGAPAGIDMLPDVEWLDAAGRNMTPETWNAPDAATLTMVLASDGDEPERVAVVLHRGGLPCPISLPAPRAGHVWRLLADSADPQADERDLAGAREPADPDLVAAPRSVLIATERPREEGGRMMTDPALLERLARATGIASEWWDVSGRHFRVSDDTRRALLAGMQLPAATQGEARDTLRRLSDEHDRRVLPQALVSHGASPAELPLAIEPGLARRPLWLTIEREDGETQHVRLGSDDGTLVVVTGADGLPAQSWRVNLPPLPFGRHRVRRDDAPDAVCHLAVAPERCFVPDVLARGGRRFGIAAQLYALRRQGDAGIGDFTTLARLAERAGLAGAATVGVNPLHMLFPAQRERASPYHPSDRRFLDPIYIDVPGLPASGGGDFVAYREIWPAKLAALEAAFAASGPADAGFGRFLEERGDTLRGFAIFQTVAESRPGSPWRDWPPDLRSPRGQGVAAFAASHAERVRFHLYLQYLADRQLAAAAETGRQAGLEFGLYRDLAVGAAPDGAESWAMSDDLAEGAWVGAPPDPLAPQGQNWHLPPPIPWRRQRDGYASFVALLAANMRHAGVLRIDHVMGLSRLFWIPDGGSGADGAYVAYPFADLLGQVALESIRAGCMVIGEDLGTVAEGLRERLAAADMLSYRVLLLEREGPAFRPASGYPSRAVACVTTHDLPPMAGWWEGADVLERGEVGLLTQDQDAAGERKTERAALLNALAGEGVLDRPPDGQPPQTEDVVEAAYGFAARTPCDLVLVQADDLAGARVGVNLPGTDTERPNWRRRLGPPVETLLETDAARVILGTLRGQGRAAEE
jgi:glycogen operon protein